MTSTHPAEGDGPGDNLLGSQRTLTESDRLDALTTPGIYRIPGATVAAVVGAPEANVENVWVTSLGRERVVQVVFTEAVEGFGGRVWCRHSGGGGWSTWSGVAGNRSGTPDLLHLADVPQQPGHVLKINHCATGEGRGSGQTYGIDISNWPSAMQAVVIHQYSNMREAFRLDNTDTNAGIYINNTRNPTRNPGGSGEGAAFLKFHPFDMGNFRDFAYLMDDLTFLNSTAKTWSFQSQSGPIVEFKDASGEVVASINQNGDLSGAGTGWIALPVPNVAPLTGSGAMRIRRFGPQVWLAFEGVGCTPTGDTEDLTEPSFIPVGYRAPLGQGPVGWVAISKNSTVVPVAVIDGGKLRLLQHGAAAKAALSPGELHGTLTWITDDPMPV